MDLISYYAKFGPKKPNGEASGKAARSSGVNKKIASQQATPVVPVDSAPPDDPFNDTVDSDVEEDDSKEIPPKELVKLMRLLRSPLAHEIRPFVIKFNETHRIECTHCTSANSECQITPTASRCQPCASKKRACSRTDVANTWIIRHKFNVSWKKAEEVRKQGLVLVRKDLAAPQGSAVPKTEEDQQANMEVRTSHRTPVRRVRKEPAPIVASIEASAASRARARPPKRALASAPPRADHKRRKVLDTQVPVQSEPEATSASISNPGRGREILSAPEFKQNAKSGPSIVTPGRIAIKLPAPKTAFGSKSGAQISRPDAIVLLSGRVTDTEKRLDAMEARLQKAELGLATRQHVVAELNGTIEELESNGDVQGATGRLRALHASLLDEDVDIVSAGGGWDPSDGVLIDDPDAKSLTPEGYEGTIPDNLEGETALGGDGSTILVDNTTESPILENGLTIAAP